MLAKKTGYDMAQDIMRNHKVSRKINYTKLVEKTIKESNISVRKPTSKMFTKTHDRYRD
jgi:hypothetical protein